MKRKNKALLVTMLPQKMDPITVEDIYKKKRIKIALSNCTGNNLVPQTTDREVAKIFLTSIPKFL
jgi:hypothetical protein